MAENIHIHFHDAGTSEGAKKAAITRAQHGGHSAAQQQTQHYGPGGIKVHPNSKTHPLMIKHKGETYYQTGKTGTHHESNEHAAEYSNSHDLPTGKRRPKVESRIWHRLPSNKIHED